MDTKQAIEKLVEAYNVLAKHPLDAKFDSVIVDSFVALALVCEAGVIIPENYTQTPEDTGFERGYGAILDAKQCLVSALKGQYSSLNFTQAVCELWAAAANLALAVGLKEDSDYKDEVLKQLNPFTQNA